MFRLSRPNSGMFRLCPTYVSTLSTRFGYISTVSDLCFDSLDRNRVHFDFVLCLSYIASRPRYLSRKTALSRFSVLANETKKMNRFYKKNVFFVIFGIFG